MRSLAAIVSFGLALNAALASAQGKSDPESFSQAFLGKIQGEAVAKAFEFLRNEAIGLSESGILRLRDAVQANETNLGTVSHVELISKEALGERLVRLRYLAFRRKGVELFEFTYYRPINEWRTLNVTITADSKSFPFKPVP